jgi:CheY-like chemotaxis protein
MTKPQSNSLQKINTTKNILLADDDIDDCSFFREALEELQRPASLTTVNDGEQLMTLLNASLQLPDVVFLDINMPRKNGFECLLEIMSNDKLKALPVIIFTTTFEQEAADRLYRYGAQYFICKPAAFSDFKKLIQQALMLIERGTVPQPSKERFMLTVQGGEPVYRHMEGSYTN